MKKICLLIISIILFSFAQDASAQKENNRWIFGAQSGIEFDAITKVPKVANQGLRPNYNLEGCAIANDPLTGNLLFYTDGVKVYNKNHVLMQNGDTLGGINDNTPAQQAAISVVPNCQGNLFYIFVNTANHNSNSPAYGNLYYNVVDMTKNNGLGAVTIKRQLIRNDADEGMIVVPNFNENKYWLIMHTPRSNKWRSILIPETPSVLKDTTRHTLFTLKPFNGKIINSTYNLKYNNVVNKIAFGNWTPQQYVQTLDFDISSGVLSNFKIVDSTAINAAGDNTTSQIIGIEFSPDGTKLYASSLNTLKVYQYDLSNNNKRTLLYTEVTSANNGTMKLGPDGRIYHRADLTNPRISVIKNPNAAGAACNYTAYDFVGLSQADLGYYNFPEHAVFQKYAPVITGSNTFCEGTSINLEASEGNKWLWSNGDTSKLISVDSPGTYTCLVSYPNGCAVNTPGFVLTQNVKPLADAGVDKQVDCGTKTTLTATASLGTAPYVFQWIGNPVPGATYADVTAGTYVLKVTDAKGCEDLDTVLVSNINSQFTLEIEGVTTYCKGDVAILKVKTIGEPSVFTYLWSNGATDSVINPTIVSDTVFTVVVSDDKGCTQQQSISLSTKPAAVANFDYQFNGLNVQFYGVTANGVFKWTWDFGDRTELSNDPSPVHKFNEVGEYEITLVVENECGMDTIKYSIQLDGSNGGGSTGVKEIFSSKRTDARLAVYPNPTQNVLNVKYDGKRGEEIVISLFDNLGRQIFVKSFINLNTNSTFQINVRDYFEPSMDGIYFLRTQSPEKIFINKVLFN